MNKKLMIFGVIGFFAMALVTAGLIVNSFKFEVGVDEPFAVQYAVLGDAGNYDVAIHGNCNDLALDSSEWFSTGDTSVPTGNMFPAESRKLCVKIDNAGEAPIDYTITSEITTGLENYAECAVAFPEETLVGSSPVPGKGTLVDGMVFYSFPEMLRQ